jgi:hypothetical protein
MAHDRETVRIGLHFGPREALRPLFELAEDSRATWLSRSLSGRSG